jgi:hypothetical protein
MSSSSDIEKLFEQFGGDANAYQEIGRESDARTARTRWPLLVTLDLTQPAIPAIDPHREAKPQQPVSVAPRTTVHEDTTPKDVASVTRAKAPLFTRPHRRDIPPVPVAAAQPATPSGASRFGTADELDESAARAAAGVASSGIAAAPGVPVAPAAAAPALIPVPAQVQAQASTSPTASAWSASSTNAAPPASIAPAVRPVSPSPALQFRAPAVQPVPPVPAAASAWARAAAPVYGSASTALAPSMQPVQAPKSPYPAGPAEPAQPPSILGKMFPAQTPSAPPQAAAPSRQAASLQSVFDRLRGTPAQSADAPAGASRGGFASWLTNGQRHS